MIVRLSHSQANGVRHRVPELHAATMRERRRAVNRTHHDYDLPAIAWRQILDVLLAECYGPLGGKLDSVPESLYRAIAKISKNVAMIEHHPAFEGAGMIGWQPVVLPCFAVGGTTKRWSPYPEPGAQFILLWPRSYEVEPLGVCTTWRANHAVHGRPVYTSELRYSWTYSREAHDMFVGATAR